MIQGGRSRGERTGKCESQDQCSSGDMGMSAPGRGCSHMDLAALGMVCPHSPSIPPCPGSTRLHTATLALSLLPQGAPTVSLTAFTFLSSYIPPALPAILSVVSPSLHRPPGISPCPPSLQEGWPHPLAAGGPQQLVQWPPAGAQDQPAALIPQVPGVPLQRDQALWARLVGAQPRPQEDVRGADTECPLQ